MHLRHLDRRLARRRLAVERTIGSRACDAVGGEAGCFLEAPERRERRRREAPVHRGPRQSEANEPEFER